MYILFNDAFPGETILSNVTNFGQNELYSFYSLPKNVTVSLSNWNVSDFNFSDIGVISLSLTDSFLLADSSVDYTPYPLINTDF